MPKKRRLLSDDAAPGEEAALKYFLRHDQKIAFAWWFFCLFSTDHKSAFSRQIEELAARIGRPVTHVDGIRVALRFWELSMSSDPAFADQWRVERENMPRPKPYEWGELGRWIDQLAEQEWRNRPVSTPEEKEQAALWFRLKTGQTAEEFFGARGLTEDEAGEAIARQAIIIDMRGTALGLVMWTSASPRNKIIALADRALLKRGAS